MIDFKDVRFTYDGEHFVLDDINLHIEQGGYTVSNCIMQLH